MKKKMLAIVLCLTMLMSMVPVSVVAEGTDPELHAHTTHEGWTAWGDDAQEEGKLPATGGKYYLTQNVDLQTPAGVASAQDITLCLNGKVVDCTTAKRAYRLSKGAKLTICDCSAATHEGTYTAGSICNATNTMIMIGQETPAATLNIYEGIFEDNTITGSGAVIVAQGGSTVNIHGGLFRDNEASSNAGVIYASDTTLNILGGTWTNNTAKSAGGAVYVRNAAANLSGGTISKNSANYGGGVYIEGNSPVTLKGVCIEGNTAAVRGAGLDYVGSSTLTVGGATKITGNKVGESINNLVLVNGRKLQLDETNAPLTEGAKIGISICTWQSSTADYDFGSSAVFATNATQAAATEYFTTDLESTEHYVQLKGDTLRFAVPKPEHPVEGYHTHTEWTEWTKTNELPKTSGQYYLSGDVDITATNGIAVNTQQDIVLCLNGYTVTGKDRIYRLSLGANVTICDCTAYYSEDGEFVSGKLIPGTKDGGVAALVADGAGDTVTKLTLKDIIIDGTGKTGSNGGAIQLGAAGATVDVQSCIVRNCTASSKGGAIHNHSGILTVTDTVITGNTAGYGGGIFTQNASKTTLTNVTITDNTATNYGGGIDNELTVGGSGFLKIEGDTVIADNYNSKAKHTSNVNLLNQTRRIQFGTLGENASIGVIAERSSDAQDLGNVTICEQGGEAALAYVTSDMGHDVVVDGQALKIVKRAHADHTTDECGHDSVTWLATAAIPNTTGHYYLTNNVTVSSTTGAAMNTGAEVTICLNGYSIIGAEGCRLFRLSNGTVLNICDCNGHGKLTGGNNANGGVVWIGKDASDSEGGNLKLYGGTVTGNTAGTTSALIAIPNGSFTLAGGAISNNESRAILLQNGSFTMTGGQITDNTYNSQDGTALRMTGGTFTMTGGQISGNTSGSSGTIRIDNGTATLSGGQICNNTAVGAAGLLAAGGDITLSGVKITDNTATGSGAGLYILNAAQVTLNGTEITGNTAGNKGAGVFYNGTGLLTIGGATKITDNKIGETDSNLHLTDGKTFALQPLTEGAMIGLTGDLNKIYQDTRQPVGTNAVQENVATFFTSDQGKLVEQQEGILYLALDPNALHAPHATDECGHESVTWQHWIRNDSLPTTSGHFYLTENVTLGSFYGVAFNTGAEVTICLNGFTINGAGTGRVFRISNGTVVNICDCTGHGKITNCANDKAGVAWIGMDEGDSAPGTLNLYSGKITGCTAGEFSALIHVDAGSFTMAGGTFTKNESRIIFVRSGEATISGGKITDNTFGKKDGGVLRMQDGSFTMTGGEISNNDNGESSGILRLDAGTATISGGKITNNRAYCAGAIITAGGKLTVTNAQITNNTASASGGAMYLFNNSEVYLGKGTVLTGNTAGNNGGAVYSNGAKVVLEDVTITDNGAEKTGGGVYFDGGEVTMTQVTVQKNKATSGGGVVSGKENKLTLDQCTVSGNEVSFAAGGLLIQSMGNVTMTDSKISSNKNTGGNGGGVYISYQGKLDLKSGEIDDNTTKGFGGGVYLADQMVMSGGTISGNSSGKEGGGIYITEGAWKNADGKTEYSDGVFTMKGGSISYNATKGNGGGVCVRGQQGVFYMYGGTISYNEALNTASGTGHCGGVLVQGKGTFYMYGGKLSNNAATSQGGAIRVTANSHVGLYGGTISGNTAYRGAGAYIEADFTMENCTITENVATNEGAGVYISGCKMTMNSGIISNNSIADKDQDEKPDGNGAGLTVRGNAQCVMNGGEIIGNSAKHAGGVLVQSGGVFTMNDGLIAENRSHGGYGGGLYNSRSTVHLLGGEFRDNVSSHSGGALYTDGVFTADGCTFTHNTVTAALGGTGTGGAIKIGQKANASMNNCTFTENSVLGRGGAIDMGYKANVQLTECTFTGNTSSTNGGAIGVFTVCKLETTGVTFQQNQAVGSGGAIYSEPNTQLTFTDTVFEGNKGNAGGAVYAAITTQAVFRNCTLTGNTGTRFGSAIYVHGGVQLTDTTVKDNLGKAHAITIDGTEWDSESFLTGVNQFAGNVIVADNEGGGLELLGGACVNIHGDGLGDQALILVTQPQGGITKQIFGAYDYSRQGDVYTLRKGTLALSQADPVTLQEEPEVPATEDPEAPEAPQTTGREKTVVLLVFGGVAVAAVVLTVIAVLSVRKMKKRKAA